MDTTHSSPHENHENKDKAVTVAGNDIDIDIDADADAIFAELEAEGDVQDTATLATAPAQQQQQHSTISQSSTSRTKQPSIYQTLKSDDETLRYTTEHHKAIVHFSHSDFARCSVMDEHLTLIAQCHADADYAGSGEGEDGAVSFAKVDVRDAEFVVQKLNIRVLPCVVGFVDGQVMGRIVGFEGIVWGATGGGGGGGSEKGIEVTKGVEQTMVGWGVLKRSLVKRRGGKGGNGQDEDDAVSESEDELKTNVKNGRRGIRGRKQKVLDEDDDWD